MVTQPVPAEPAEPLARPAADEPRQPGRKRRMGRRQRRRLQLGLGVLAVVMLVVAVGEWMWWPLLRQPAQDLLSRALHRPVLLGPDILPSFTAAQFAERGAVLPAEGQAHEGLLAFVELQNGEAAPTYYAGTTNFWAITRYNWSSYYAMAVIALADAVARAR